MRQLNMALEAIRNRNLAEPGTLYDAIEILEDLIESLSFKTEVLDKGFVALVDFMGDDLSVANAARVSFKKRKAKFETDLERLRETGSRKGSDESLVRFLADHAHWTPFGHVQVTFHLKMPVTVARQFMRSNIGIVYNETSRRYVDDPPEFYEPKNLRARPDGSIKQGSGQVLEPEIQDECDTERKAFLGLAKAHYSKWLSRGVAPEMARDVLPVSMYTELWATMSLAAAARVVKLRWDSHAQWEVQQYAVAIAEALEPLFMHCWKALTRKESNGIVAREKAADLAKRIREAEDQDAAEKVALAFIFRDEKG